MAGDGSASEAERLVVAAGNKAGGRKPDGWNPPGGKGNNPPFRGSKGWGLINPLSLLTGVKRGGEGGTRLGEGEGEGILDVVPARLGKVDTPPGGLDMGESVDIGDSSDDVNETAGGDDDDDDEDVDNFSPER